MTTTLVFPSGNKITLNSTNKATYPIHLGDELRYDGVVYDVIRIIHSVDSHRDTFCRRTIVLGSKWVF